MTKLAEAILDRRVQSPSYFSGRLLAASDLTAERDAHLARQRMLGRAIGAGIVEGLWVAPAPGSTAVGPAVTVSKGFAIDLDGQLRPAPVPGRRSDPRHHRDFHRRPRRARADLPVPCL